MHILIYAFGWSGILQHLGSKTLARFTILCQIHHFRNSPIRRHWPGLCFCGRYYIFATVQLEDLGQEAGRLALRDAVLMAAADGTVDDDEKEALQEIAEHLGLAPDAVNRLLQWTKEGYAWMNSGYELLNDLSG